MATTNAINNISNPLASTALTIDPGAAGDSYVQFNINTTGEFRIGTDDTDDSFRISQGSALGTNDTFVMTAAGERTLPLQPIFKATPASTATDVTGDATVYTGVFGTETFDVGGHFDGTSTFTAPVAGKYYFYALIKLGDVVAANYTDLLFQFDKNTGTLYPFIQYDPQAGFAEGSSAQVSGSLFIDLAASDTITVQVKATGGGKTVDFTSGNSNYFSGFLVC